MKYIRTASYDEVCLQILANEEHAVIGISEDAVRERHHALTLDVNLANPAESSERKDLLFKHRNTLLLRLPPDMSWYVAEVEESDYNQFHLICIDGWNEFSQNTGKVSSAAEIFADEKKRTSLFSELRSRTLPKEENEKTLNWILTQIDAIERNELRKIRDNELNYRLVFVRDTANRLTLIDGNHRAVAIYAHYILNGNEALPPHEVFVGWTNFGCVWTGADPYFEFSLHNRRDWRKFIW